MQRSNQSNHLQRMIYKDSAVLILRLHFPTRFVYTTLSTFMHNTFNSPICDLLETKCKTYFTKDYTIPSVLTHLLTYFQVILTFFFDLWIKDVFC